MEKITAEKIVHEVGMSARPEYYSGRGARRSDLSGEKLIAIHKIITEKLGKSQAKEFVTMVKSISCLSATNFLNSLFALEANDWVYHQREENDIDLGPDGPGRLAIGIASLGEAMFSSSHGDETYIIRNSFLQELGIPTVKPQKKSCWYEW
ncbi:MAG: hypothetical protein IKT41_03940 [Clostridia bacterium]|nr:hypothetical protein [Clostridia bacterium]